MARRTELEVIAKGVESWNRWIAEQRKRDSKFVADLSDTDFTDSEEWGGSEIWKRFRSHRDEQEFRCDLNGIDLRGANLSRCNMSYCLLNDADISNACLKQVRMFDGLADRSNLACSDLEKSQLRHSSMESVDFRKATLKDADLSEVRLVNSNLLKSDLSGVMLRNANMRGVKYKPSLLRGRCHSLAGVTQIGGNTRLRRDLLDQDYIDSSWLEWRRRARIWNPMTWPRGLLLFGWSLFDYGRSWTRVVLLATMFILTGGFLYSATEGTHVAFPAGDLVFHAAAGERSNEVVTWGNEFDPRDGFSYHVFVAAMGFCTLGISDLVVPKTDIGKLLIFGNVATGFLTLGLLLAVLGNIFARRA